MKTASLLTVIIAILLLASACGTSRRGEPLNGALALNEEQAHGQEVFMRNCQKCHPNGGGGQGPPINNVPLPGALMRLRVRSKAFVGGIGRMPSFKKHEISEDDMDALVAYLKVLKKHDEKVYEARKN